MLLLHVSIVIERGTESRVASREVTGGGRPAQPGLKATLKVLGAGGCCTLLAVCEDIEGGGGAAPASGGTFKSRCSC